MRRVGLTGGIASGKSTVARMIRDRGVRVIDADAIARRLSEPGGSLYRAFAAHFSPAFFLPDGEMDRRRIAAAVFANPEERKWVDAAAHPLIKGEAEAEMREAERCGETIVVLDVPLLFEAGWDALVDETWLVYVPPAVQIARLMARNGYTEAEARARIAAQMALDAKCARADVVLDNAGMLDELAARLDEVWEERVHERVP